MTTVSDIWDWPNLNYFAKYLSKKNIMVNKLGSQTIIRECDSH